MDMADIRDKIVPTNDYIFKKLFGEEKDKIILIPFLNALFKEYDFLPYIEDVTIKNSETTKSYDVEKQSRLDIKAKIDNETYIDIEMQNRSYFDLIERGIYYCSKILAEETVKGRNYKYPKVVSIWIINDELDSDNPHFKRKNPIEVDKHIWDSACQILNSWKYKYPDLFVSINISPKDFYFIDVSSEIETLVQKYNIDPIKLRIEITETAMMSDPEERLRIFDELRSKGFIVEMDDFGSGYSSLNMLKDMPVDVLKIDMKFLDSSKKAGRSQTIIKNVINMSNELEMTALTEGVETQQQYNQLVSMGCKLFQGYYFAKPMPLNEFEKFIATKKEEGKL